MEFLKPNIYVDEYTIADDVRINCIAPFTKDDILNQIDIYIDGEEESSLVHYLTNTQIDLIYDRVRCLLIDKGYEVVE
jgi:hypothetical protein